VADFGQRLRDAREALELSLEEAEAKTYIRRAFLEAFEEERFDATPSGSYGRGLLRNYARFLGLDPEDIVSEYRRRSGTRSQPMPAVLDEPLLRVRRNILPALFVALMALLVAAVVGWCVYNRVWLGQQPPLPTLPWLRDIPALLGPATNTPVSVATRPTQKSPTSGASATDSAAVIPSPTRSVDRSTESDATVQAREIAASATVPPTPVVRQRTATPTLAVRPSATVIQGVLVQGVVTQDTYVFVTVDGVAVQEEILPAGQRPAWQGRESVAIRVGNAAGIELTVNGVTVDPLGDEGQVVDVSYTLDTLPIE